MHYLNGIAFIIGWFVLGGFLTGIVSSAVCAICFLIYDYAIKRVLAKHLGW